MDITRLSSKGQIIIPQAIREAHHWKTGEQFSVQAVKDGILLTPLKPKASAIAGLIGCVGYKGPKKVLQDMEHAIENEAHKKG